MKKLIIAILVIMALAVLFVGCSDNNNQPGATSPYMPTATYWPETTLMPGDQSGDILPGDQSGDILPGDQSGGVLPGGNMPTVSPNTNMDTAQ